MDKRLQHLPTYTIRDTVGNTLRHQVLPREAELTCRGNTPIPFMQVPDNDATRAAHARMSDIAGKQLPLGGMPQTVTVLPQRNILGQLESPLSTLCRAVREQSPSR